MAKFCGSCGAQLDDSANVCGVCGTPLEGVKAKTQIPGINDLSPEKKEKIKKYGIIGGVAVIALIVVIIIISTIAGSVGYKGTVKKFVKGFDECDTDKLLDITSAYNEVVADYEDNGDYDEEMKDRYESMSDTFREIMKEEAGRDYKVKYKITDSYVLEDRDFEDLVEELTIEEMKDNGKMKTVVDPTDTFSKVRCVEIELICKGRDGEESVDLDLYLSKEKGGWKVLYPEIEY